MSLVRQQFFIKDVAPDEVVPVNHWGVYQAVRWAAGSRLPEPPPGPGSGLGGPRGQWAEAGSRP